MKHGFNFGYFLSEGLHSIVSHGLMSFAAVSMIVACLIIMGSFSLLALNADQMLGQVEDDNEFLLYIDESYTDEQIHALTQQVRSLSNVASATFIPKEDAKDVFLEGRENEGLYANIPDTVFRDRISVHVVDLTLFRQTVDQAKALDGVANYRAEAELAEGFVTVRNASTALAGMLVAILAAVSLFIIANTIRLATFSRRNEIAIMKMCGATNGFVRWPFVFEGLILGLLGALVAFFLQWGIYTAAGQAMTDSGAIMLLANGIIPFSTLWLPILGVFLLAGTLIGALGSGFAIRRFLQV